MLQSLLQRAREARAAELGDGEGLEEGFTLIELMVVLLIIAILLAIAIPTFLGVTNSASDRAAQSNLTNGPDRGQGHLPEQLELPRHQRQPAGRHEQPRSARTRRVLLDHRRLRSPSRPTA